jgi:hypothetical protein
MRWYGRKARTEMAKIEGDQTIPAELQDYYDAELGAKNSLAVVGKRYPFKRPDFQEGGKRVTQAQINQRNRFKVALGLFANATEAQRQRWYSAAPEWNSYLWYYNYFMMSALAGNANPTGGGAGVIKSIQVVKEEVPTTGGKSFAISAVDPTKTVVMVYGNSYISDTVQRGYNTVSNNSYVDCALSPNVDTDLAEVRLQGQVGNMDIQEGSGSGTWGAPYVDSLSASNLRVRLPNVGAGVTCGFSWEVIERKAQTVYPVITSIGAEEITIDWSKEPSVAADVSIIVIEYI